MVLDSQPEAGLELSDGNALSGSEGSCHETKKSMQDCIHVVYTFRIMLFGTLQ